MSTEAETAKAEKLKVSTLLAFAGPAAPIAAMGLPIVVYLPPFYAETMGLGLALVGTIFMITRFWDVFTDPIMGILSDKFETRWGRRRHWIVLSVPLMLVSVFMVFLPQGEVTGLYLLFWMVMLYVGWTLLTISHLSWGAELSPDYHERSRVQGYREVFLILGMVFVLALPAIIERVGAENVGMARVGAMGWFVIILLPITVAIAVTKVGERKTEPPQPIPWRNAIGVLTRSRPLRMILALDILGGIAGGIVAALFLFLAADVLKLGAWSSIMLLGYFLSGVCFIPLMLAIAHRIGKHRALAASSLFNGLTLPLILTVPEGNVAYAMFCWVLFGVNMAAGPFLLRSIMADVADHDAIESGQQRTGLFYSMLTMTNKVGHALAIGLAYWVLDRIGFVPGAENAEPVLDAVRNVYVWPAAVISVVNAVIIWRFPIDQAQQEANRRVLEARAAERSAASASAPPFPEPCRPVRPAELPAE